MFRDLSFHQVPLARFAPSVLDDAKAWPPKHAKPFKVSLDFEQTFLSDKVSSSFATVFFLASFAPFEEAAIEVSFTGPSRGGQNQPNGGLLTGLS